MGRPERPNIEGGIYHVMNRGNRKAFIFEDDYDRRRFLRTLIEEQNVHGVKIMAGTLLDNHFHLAVVTPNGNLSEFMARLQGRYARYFNRRHELVGHVFQGRFRHVQIENDVHLLTALCYIFMNPVTARLVDKVEQFKWSSYAATVGHVPLPSYLSVEWLEALFPTLSLPAAQQRLRQLMSEPKPVAAYLKHWELDVDTDSINHVIRSYTGEQLNVASLPRVYRTALRPPLAALLQEVGGERCRFIREARIMYGYKNAEIAKVLGVTANTISKIFCDDRRTGGVLPPPSPPIGVAPRNQFSL